MVSRRLTGTGGQDLRRGVQGAELPPMLKKVAGQNLERLAQEGGKASICVGITLFILRPTKPGLVARRDLKNAGVR